MKKPRFGGVYYYKKAASGIEAADNNFFIDGILLREL